MTGQPDPVAPPVFLERGSYRRRRMWDAVRILPFLGIMLWLVPLMWTQPAGADAGGVATSSALLYVFAVWVFLAIAARLLWRGTAPSALPTD